MILDMQYLLTTTENALMDLLSFGLIPPITAAETGPIETLRHTINAICRELLPDAIGLTDAFGFTDWELDRCVLFYAYVARKDADTSTPNQSALWGSIMAKCTKLYGSLQRGNH